MINFNFKLHSEATSLAETLNRNQKAMLKRIAWYERKGHEGCCFETIEQMGNDLSKWGGKDVKRTQALAAYRKIKNLVNSCQPQHKTRFRRTLNELGIYVLKLINEGLTKTDTQVYKNRHPNMAKTDTQETQKPTPNKYIKIDKTKTKEKAVKFSNHVNHVLDSLDDDLSHKAIEEYKTYSLNTPINNPSLVMEKICAKHVVAQAFRDEQRFKEKRRALAMEEQAKYLRERLDSIEIGDKQYRMELTQKCRVSINASLGIRV